MHATASRMRFRLRWRRHWAPQVGIGLLALLAICAIWLYSRLHGSLPQLDGAAVLAGLSAPVTVERDALGIPLIRGANRLDVARATGFVHAQERFFQMDLLRRTAAGELAALFGPAALDLDRAHRLHRFRHRARQALTAVPPQIAPLIDAYTAGVNAGLAALAALRSSTCCCESRPNLANRGYTAGGVRDVSESADQQWPRESTRDLLHDQLPPALADFLDPPGTEWDAPLRGSAPLAADTRSRSVRPAPPASRRYRSGDPRTSQPPAFALFFRPYRPMNPETVSGSNNWAVAGQLTAHGGALLANDMHLARVPNIWYRAALLYPDERGHEWRISGVTLPGTPAIAAGGNGHIAWGFTNSEGDWADLVILEPGADDDSYLTPTDRAPLPMSGKR